MMGDSFLHSAILVPSLWRVFPIIPSSQTDMPLLTTITLNKECAFSEMETVHVKSSFPSSPSFLDITPELLSILYTPKPVSFFPSTFLQ